MEEVFTCICGKQHMWTICKERLECCFCGREYLNREKIEPSEFNIRRKDLLLKDAEVTEGEPNEDTRPPHPDRAE